MSYSEITGILKMSIVRPSILTAHPRNTGRILFSSGDFDPEMLFPGERCLLRRTPGELAISGDGQRFKIEATQ